MSADSKIKEAQKHIADAEKALKTSFISLKFKPDLDSAADEYKSAAKCYKVARKYRECKDTYLKACELYENLKGYFHAAQCLDEVVLCCKDLGAKDFEEIPNHAERATKLYIQHGYHETAALNLSKAAEMVKQDLPEKSAEMLLRAGEVVSVQTDGEQIAAQYISRAVRILVSLKRFKEAAESMIKQFGLQQEVGDSAALGRGVLGLVLIYLALEDVVAANKAYQEWGGHCDNDTARTALQLLRAFDEEDEDECKEALKNPYLRNMDVEFARLTRDIKIPTGIQAPPSKADPPPASDEGTFGDAAAAGSSQPVAAAGSSPPVAEVQEDADDDLK
ncbi:unnamed protein product [Cyprideis torosa]|uniref:Gamma-soluble NSF attachment protein n=1 Tax=Cyprideis torosa TaxID=163714 RepID=A0A7R8ZLJ2_9CRUS|nr:unnamed protein product [Cyprideis torosa]CAG0893308.1 unnamed protein product [Cyprideis torosa]